MLRKAQAPFLSRFGCGVLLLLLAWLVPVASAMAACDWPLNFASVGQTIQVNTSSCDAFPAAQGEYGGLFRVAGTATENTWGVGVKPDPNGGAPQNEDVSGGNGGVYTFSHNLSTGVVSITLKTAPVGNAGTITLYSYVGPNLPGGGPPAAPANTLNTFHVTVSTPAPVVTNGNIGISGASGTGGAYKVGDTVAATWNNTASGDNNAGITAVTVDFSQFGGGAAVAASNSGNNWTATYVITAGAIDTTSRNVSVTATSANGSTTTADTTNATVDSIAPAVTDGRISISGASGTGGAYRIGDTVIATWNNTGGGDNNSDTISSVTVNFTQFGGGAAVSASNSSGTWTATYTIVAGAIEATNRNVSVVATDNAGNATATGDTSNATVDNIAPSVSSIVVSGTPGSGDTSMAFTVNFREPVANVSTDDFTLASTGSASGTITGVSASTGSAINVNVSGISGTGTLKVNLNGSTNIADGAGNTPAAYSSGSTHSVAVLTAPTAPTIGAATAGDGQVWVTFTAPVSNGGSAITGYTVTSNPGGITGGGNGFTSSPIVVTGLTNGTPYTFTVTATNAIGTSTASGASASATPKGNQAITFAQPAAQNFGATPTLSASATSGLTPTFSSSTTGVCTVSSGGALTFVTSGSCTIDADQAGNGAWNAANTVTRTFTVNAVAPGAPAIGTATAGDTQASITFSAPASSGGTTVTGYTVTANPGGATGTGASSPITVTGLTNGVPYTFTVTATNSAALTGAASAVSNSVVPKGAQTITFANPGTQSFGTSPNLGILGGGVASTSGLTVSFSSSTTGVCTISSGGVLTFVSAGTCTVNADQAGDSSFLPASQVSRSFTVIPVVPDAPTSVVASAGDTQASVAFVAPASTGGSAITGYTVTVSPMDVAPVNGASSPIVVTGLTNGQPYTFTVTADNVAGPGPASTASNSVTPKATQVITFNNPGPRNFGTTPTLSATSDSGLPPSFTSSTTGVCTITSGGALTFVAAGTCTINADQAGNGSYLAATQVTRSFTVNAVVPGAPAIGTATATAPDAASVTFTAPASNGGGTITGYTVTASPGGATGSGAGSPLTVAGLVPGTAYTFRVTATNNVGTGSPSAASNSVTPVPALVAGPVSATVAYGAAATPVTLAITGTPASVAIASAPSHGTVTVSGTTLSYQPTTGYAGTDSFTYTASDAYTTTPAATVSVTVANPSVAISTASLADAVAGTGYAQALATSGGAAPYTYAVTGGALPAGITLSTAGNLSGTPTATGTFNFTVTVTESSSGTGPFSASRAFTVQVDPPALVAGAVSATVAYGAAATPVALDITGTAASVAILSAPAHGTAVASGTTITYQPAPGYAGPDSFSYTASDAYTTSSPAAVSIAVAAPTVTLATTSLPAATGSNAYAQAVVAEGGTAPYAYAVTGGALPAGLVLSSGGQLSGTPTQAGSFNVTITATDRSTGTGPFSASRSYALVVEAPVLDLALDALPPASGAQDYHQPLVASGGTAPYRFEVVAGALPPGLALAASGEISGTPTASGSYGFTVQVTDANGFTGTQAYTFAVEATAQVIEAFVATPAQPVYAVGGTFAIAARGGGSGNPVVFASTSPAVCSVAGSTVTMLGAGACVLTADQAGNTMYQAAAQARLEVAIAAATPVLAWVQDLAKVYGEASFDLPDPRSTSTGAFTFTSTNPAVATVSGRTVTLVGEGTTVLVATQAAAGSYVAAEARVQLVVDARPDPTADGQVRGTNQAQVDASVLFAQTQMRNVQDRLRSIRTGGNASSTQLTLAYAGSEGAPGMSVPVGGAANAAMPSLPQGWGVWLAGTATFGEAGRNGASGGAFDFNTGGITLGADRAIGEHALLGMAASWGRQGTDFDGTPSEVDADQASLAVYGLWRAGEHLFVDGMLASGQLDFDLARWSEVAGATAHATRGGDQWFGSLTFGYEHRAASGMTLTGYGRYDGHRADLDGYREHGLGTYDLAYGRQRVDNSALAVGLEGNHAFQGVRTTWRPFWTVEYRQALENQGDVSLNYVQRPLASDYSMAMRSYNDDMLALGAGLDLQWDSGWMFSVLLGHEQGRNSLRSNSIGLQVRYGGQAGSAPVYVDDDGLSQAGMDDCRRTRGGSNACEGGGPAGIAH